MFSCLLFLLAFHYNADSFKRIIVLEEPLEVAAVQEAGEMGLVVVGDLGWLR